MRKRTHAARTMRKRRKTSQAARTAVNQNSLTGFAPLAATTKAKPLKRQLKIGVDLMGNDNAPQTLLSALQGICVPENVTFLIIGSPELAKIASPFEFKAVSEVIEMDEHPLFALRRKKNASIPTGMRLLKEGKINAFVSAGNTGALVSSAKMIVGALPGPLRPSLLTLMPTKKNPVAVLDVGANVEAKAEHLVQYALIGTAFQKTRGIAEPKVGLLNIGSEALKGTSELRLAYNELQKNEKVHFVGNIEGKTVFDGEVDVLVTDGFTGNVFLKTAEGIASLILDKISAGPKEIKNFQSLHYAEYPGAILAGIQGIVIKCHGYSSPKGFTNAVLGAALLAKEGFVQKLLNELR
jgi:glycerol-3-phosphate acyltransferase PlsX